MNIGIEFEQKCIAKLREIGFENVSGTPITDYGADIIAYRQNIKYIFQCKYVKVKQGVEAVQEIMTAKHFYSADKCAVISHSGFTRQAYNLAKPNLVSLIDEGTLFYATNIDTLADDIFSVANYVTDHDYDVIQEFEKTKRKYGRTPILPELDKTLRYKIYKNYGGYSKFLSSIGEKLKRAKPTPEQLKTEYLRIRDLLGKIPTANDIKNNTDMPYNSFHQYPLSKLQKECNDKPNVDRNITNENLIEEYLELEKTLGHKPNSVELDKYGKHSSFLYIRRFGSMKTFYTLPEIKADELIRTDPSKEDIIIMLTFIAEIMSTKGVMQFDFKELDKIKHEDKIILSRYYINNKFGSYKKLLDELTNNDAAAKFVGTIKEAIAIFKEKYKLLN